MFSHIKDCDQLNDQMNHPFIAQTNRQNSMLEPESLQWECENIQTKYSFDQKSIENASNKESFTSAYQEYIKNIEVKNECLRVFNDSQNDDELKISVDLQNQTTSSVQQQIETINKPRIRSEIQEGNDFNSSEHNQQFSPQNYIKCRQPYPTQRRQSIYIVQAMSCLNYGEIFHFDNQSKDGSQRFTLVKRFSKFFNQNILDESDEMQTFYSNISKGFLLFLVIIQVFIGAVTIPWILSIKSNKILRNCWRFVFQAVILAPFLFYEYRVGNEKIKKQYEIHNILKKDNLKKLFISALNNGFHALVILECGEYTFATNAIILGCLQNFWLSMQKIYNKEESTFAEKIGRFMCISGYIIILLFFQRIIIISIDIYFIEQYATQSGEDLYLMRTYLKKQPWQRIIIGNLFPMLSSLITVNVSKVTIDIKQHYPPFLSMFLISLFLVFNFLAFAFIFDGASFSFDSRWGVLGIFQDDRFTQFLLMGFVINSLMFLSQIFISKLFEPLVPISASLLEGPLNALLLQAFDVQFIPGQITIIGYLLIQPGQFNILLGQDIERQLLEQEERITKQYPNQPILVTDSINQSNSMEQIQMFKSQPLDKNNKYSNKKKKVSFLEHLINKQDD